ncbi:MAG: BspA family leucine-rich repeat surface protein [archaeon]|nr:BspA family leucine-rich repeat surface protein [archaeon]
MSFSQSFSTTPSNSIYGRDINLNCTTCGSEILIKEIEETQSDFICIYQCQKGHKDKKSFKDIMETIPQGAHKEMNTKCQTHNMNYEYYCSVENRNLCKKCMMQEKDKHKAHSHVELFSAALTIETKDFTDNGKILNEKLSKAKINTLQKIDEFKKNIENYYKKLQSFMDFQYYYVSNFEPEKTCYEKLQSVKFITQDLRNDLLFPNKMEEFKLDEIVSFFQNRTSFKQSANVNRNPNESIIKAIYNVKNIQKKTDIFGVDFSGFTTSNCELKIDGKIVPFSHTYQFTSTGLHKLELTAKNPNEDIDLSGFFRCCTELEEVDFSHFKAENVTSLKYLFIGCISLKNVNFSGFNSNKITDIRSIFYSCKSLKNVDVSMIKTGKCTDFSYLFFGCTELEELDLSTWDTKMVTNIEYMCHCCNSLRKINVSTWDTSKCNNMQLAFFCCYNLKEIDVSGWKTGAVTKFLWMFDSCSSLVKLDLSKWDTSNADSFRCTFKNCSNLTQILCENWNVKKVRSLNFTFWGNYSLRDINTRKWKVAKNTEERDTFAFCDLIPKENKYVKGGA